MFYISSSNHFNLTEMLLLTDTRLLYIRDYNSFEIITVNCCSNPTHISTHKKRNKQQSIGFIRYNTPNS